MTKRKIFIAAAAMIVLLFAVAKYRGNTVQKQEQQDMVQLTVIPFEVNNGWGYKVMMDNHPYIYQDVIPAIGGSHVFQSKDDAERVGNLMVKKLLQHKGPGVSEAELKELQVAGVQ